MFCRISTKVNTFSSTDFFTLAASEASVFIFSRGVGVVLFACDVGFLLLAEACTSFVGACVSVWPRGFLQGPSSQGECQWESASTLSPKMWDTAAFLALASLNAITAWGRASAGAPRWKRQSSTTWQLTRQECWSGRKGHGHTWIQTSLHLNCLIMPPVSAGMVEGGHTESDLGAGTWRLYRGGLGPQPWWCFLEFSDYSQSHDWNIKHIYQKSCICNLNMFKYVLQPFWL